MSTAPPTVFGSFRVLHQVGAGVLGPLFRAHDPDRDRLVAIKCFRLDLAPDRVHRFVAELERIVIAGAMHPALVEPLAVGIEGVDAYLVQEYVAADSLDTVLRERGALPPAEALRMSRQLADALDVAAAASLVHGALHPRDILLAPEELRLTGFGVAGALEAVGVVAPIRRPYTAPERAGGAAWDRSADVFSLAALVHELLWGRRVAGTGRHAAQSLAEIAGFDPDELRAIFARALAERPDERFATATEFADALEGSQHSSMLVGPHPHSLLLLDSQTRSSQQPQALDLSPVESRDAERALSGPQALDEPPVERFTDIDLTPETPFGADQGASRLAGPSPKPPVSSRRPIWPVAAVLLTGAILGAAVGYLVVSWLMAQGL